MANNTYAFGLAPIGGVNNAGHGGIRAYYVPSSYATDLFIGDMVTSTTTLNATEINGHKAGSLKTVVRYAAGETAVTGVIVGFEPINEYTPIGEQGKASTERVVYVMDDPNATFTVRADSDATAEIVGKNVDVTVNPGSVVTGCSGIIVDSSSANTSATLPLKVIGIAQEENEDAVGASMKLIVSLNTSTLAPHTAGI